MADRDSSGSSSDDSDAFAPGRLLFGEAAVASASAPKYDAYGEPVSPLTLSADPPAPAFDVYGNVIAPPKPGFKLAMGQRGPLSGHNSDDLKPDDMTWGDWTVADRGEPLRNRHEVLCYMAAAGSTTPQMASQLGLSASRVSILLSNSRIQTRIAEIRDAHWGANIQARFANIVPKAADLLQQMIEGNGLGAEAKTGERWDAAKWLMEKVTGKPRQEVDIDGGGTMLQLISALDQLKLSRDKGTMSQTERNVLEAAEQSATIEVDPMDVFVQQHVPEPTPDKGT